MTRNLNVGNIKIRKNFRTFRLAVVEGSDFAATCLGNALSGPVFRKVGATWTFSIGAAITFLGLPYIAFILRESVVKKKEAKKEESENGVMELIKNSVNFVLEGFRAVVKQREGRRRPFIILTYCIYTIALFANIGAEGGHRIYFAERKYDWTEDEMTVYYTLSRLTCWFGLWVLVPVLTKSVKLSDISLCILSAGVTATGYFLPVFTGSKEWLRIGNYVLNWFSFSSYILILQPILYITCRYPMNSFFPLLSCSLSKVHVF